MASIRLRCSGAAVPFGRHLRALKNVGNDKDSVPSYCVILFGSKTFAMAPPANCRHSTNCIESGLGSLSKIGNPWPSATGWTMRWYSSTRLCSIRLAAKDAPP
jgi:hypothetical protein